MLPHRRPGPAKSKLARLPPNETLHFGGPPPRPRPLGPEKPAELIEGHHRQWVPDQNPCDSVTYGLHGDALLSERG